MAGDWIKVQISTPDKAEVWAMAERLDLDPDAVVGKLIRVWSWFDEHTEEGHAPSVTKKLLDRLVGVTGFCDSLHSEGWMTETDGMVSVPNFDRHNGQSAKKRALSNERKRKSRANVAGNVTDQSRTERDTSVPREEKRRVNTVPNGTDAAASLSERVWAEGLSTLTRISGRSDKPCRTLLGKWRKAHDDSAILAAISEAERQAVSDPEAWITASLKARCPEGRSRVVDLYREVLVPTLPDLIDLDDERKRKIGALSKGQLDSMEQWRKFFEVVAECPVLIGQKPWRNGETKAVDFDFLLKHAVKIMEGKYDD